MAASENIVDNVKKNRSKLSNIQSGYLLEVFKMSFFHQNNQKIYSVY